ncbi:MAG TPA: alpha/beta fold hydrolase, partial [Opitutaceae bacterium]|nr:alpha/beta fold hydrolase [Opitutaceae bacterium]
MVREGHIDGPGGRLWYAIHGDGRAGVPLLVVHGGPGFLSVPDVVAELADERPVIFYDQLGCGRSERPADKSRFTLAHYVAELAAVRTALGLQNVHLLGQSWGCMLAAEYLL